MSKIIQAEWRSSIDIVGIILVKRDDDKLRAYIGTVRKDGGVSTNTPFEDAKYIAAHGAKLTYNEAKGFFPTHLSSKEEYAV